MDYYAYVSVFDVLAKLGIAYAIKYSDSDRLLLYGFLNLVVVLVGFVLYFFYAKIRFKDLKTASCVKKDLFRSMLCFSGWNVFGSFAYMLKSQGLNMLLNLFFGPVINAARGVSNMVMSAIHGFQANVVVAFRPQLVQSYAGGDFRRVEKLFFSLSKVSFVLLSTLSIPIIIEIDYILKLWLGSEVPDYTIPFTILVLINMVISSLNTPVSQVVHATGHMKNYQIGTSLAVCSIVPIAWIFLKQGYNATTVYWISLLVTIVNQIICNVLLKQVFDYNIISYLKYVILPCVVFAILSPIVPIVITFLFPIGFIRLVLVSVVSVFLSMIIALLVVLDNSEREMLKSVAHKLLKK